MKKNLFITIMALAALAMPMFSSCSSDDDNATVLPTDPDTPSPLDDAVQALYKSTWYWVGYAEDGEYTQVGTGVGDPMYWISFSEGSYEGSAGGRKFFSHKVVISGNKIHIDEFIDGLVYTSDPLHGLFKHGVGKASFFEIREDGLLKLAKTENSYILLSTTRDTKTAWHGDKEYLKEMGLEWAE